VITWNWGFEVRKFKFHTWTAAALRAGVPHLVMPNAEPPRLRLRRTAGPSALRPCSGVRSARPPGGRGHAGTPLRPRRPGPRVPAAARMRSRAANRAPAWLPVAEQPPPRPPVSHRRRPWLSSARAPPCRPLVSSRAPEPASCLRLQGFRLGKTSGGWAES